MGRRTTPYQVFAEEPVEVSTMGEATVPTAVRVPSTRSSPRLVSSPEIMTSLVVNWRVTPGWMVSVTPCGTVRSPATG